MKARQEVIPHARTWRAIRERCDKHADGNCAYPFCRCDPETPNSLAKQEAA